jgi:hypothetical protein
MARVGEGWCLVSDPSPGGAEWLVASTAVVSARGLSPLARPPSLRPVTSRLGLGSVLREVAAELSAVTLHSRDGQSRRGRLARVGKDFLELLPHDGAVEVLPFSGLAAVRR